MQRKLNFNQTGKSPIITWLQGLWTQEKHVWSKLSRAKQEFSQTTSVLLYILWHNEHLLPRGVQILFLLLELIKLFQSSVQDIAHCSALTGDFLLCSWWHQFLCIFVYFLHGYSFSFQIGLKNPKHANYSFYQLWNHCFCEFLHTHFPHPTEIKPWNTYFL